MSLEVLTRHRVHPPTEEGYFYARYIYGRDIEPHRVRFMTFGIRKELRVDTGSQVGNALDQYVFFGPVAECIEI